MGEWRCRSIIFDLTLDESEWSASRPSRYILLEKSPRCPLDRRLGGPQSRSGPCGVEKNFLPLSWIERRPSSLQPVAITSRIEVTSLDNAKQIIHIIVYLSSIYITSFNDAVQLRKPDVVSNGEWWDIDLYIQKRKYVCNRDVCLWLCQPNLGY
jgi:hypothetical protein